MLLSWKPSLSSSSDDGAVETWIVVVLVFLPFVRRFLFLYFHSRILALTSPCFMIRSSRPEVFCKKGVLRNFPKFTGKHLCQSLFNKVAGLFKIRLWRRCFPVNFGKFLKTPSFIEHLWWLLMLRSGPLDCWLLLLCPALDLFNCCCLFGAMNCAINVAISLTVAARSSTASRFYFLHVALVFGQFYWS